LRPVAAMAAVARQITEGDLARRIDGPPSQDELGQLASTLNSMIERLSETMERERRFTSDASHELRTPLTSIETSIDVTLSQTRPPAEYQRVLGMVRGQTRRLHSLTRQLLLLSRLDAKQVRDEFVEIELNGFLDAIVEAFRESHPGATVEMAPSPVPLEIRGEIELLARAFMNVLENAVIYAGASAVVRVETQRGANQTAIVAIEDNGPGVPEHLAGEIFQRFRRGDEARHAAGSGLGLAIVEAIMLAHGGEVRLAPKTESTGARFEFSFRRISA
jgi:two-component system OmpR family sensor kinase